MRMLLPDPCDDPDLERLYAPPQASWLRIGVVASVDGSAAVDGLSAGLSGPADREVFRLLRGHADVVLVGAGTARAEAYRPARVSEQRRLVRRDRGQRDTPVVAVVSRGAGLPPDSALLAPGAGTLLLTTAHGARSAPAGVEAVVTGEHDVDLQGALAQLHARGLRQVLCEGGPALAGSLAAAGLVDELCVTTSPQLAGGAGPRLLASPGELRRPLRLASLLSAGDVLLARWTVAPDGAPGDPRTPASSDVQESRP